LNKIKFELGNLICISLLPTLSLSNADGYAVFCFSFAPDSNSPDIGDTKKTEQMFELLENLQASRRTFCMGAGGSLCVSGLSTDGGKVTPESLDVEKATEVLKGIFADVFDGEIKIQVDRRPPQ